jgi:hypothetical protein
MHKFYQSHIKLGVLLLASFHGYCTNNIVLILSEFPQSRLPNPEAPCRKSPEWTASCCWSRPCAREKSPRPPWIQNMRSNHRMIYRRLLRRCCLHGAWRLCVSLSWRCEVLCVRNHRDCVMQFFMYMNSEWMDSGGVMWKQSVSCELPSREAVARLEVCGPCLCYRYRDAPVVLEIFHSRSSFYQVLSLAYAYSLASAVRDCGPFWSRISF